MLVRACVVSIAYVRIYWESTGGDEVSPKVLSIAFRAQVAAEWVWRMI